jgi:hypothetical protein
MSRAQLANDIWRACDIMRRDNNCGGVMEYVEHLSWLLFLKFLDEQEAIFAAEAEVAERPYGRIIGSPYRWSEWVPKALGSKRGFSRVEMRPSSATGMKCVFSVCRLVSRRCHNISAIHQLCLTPSQNRTSRCPPSGSSFNLSALQKDAG